MTAVVCRCEGIAVGSEIVEQMPERYTKPMKGDWEMRCRARWWLIEKPIWKLIDWHEGTHQWARLWCLLCMAAMRGRIRVQEQWRAEREAAERP